MVTVQLSQNEKLILPESLGRSLGLREGDRVEVLRHVAGHSDVLWLQRKEKSYVPGSLTDLSRIVSSSRPVGSVDIEEIVNKRD